MIKQEACLEAKRPPLHINLQGVKEQALSLGCPQCPNTRCPSAKEVWVDFCSTCEGNPTENLPGKSDH